MMATKESTKTDTDGTKTNPSESGIDELARIIATHMNTAPSQASTSTSATTRTYTSPLMGTSARAAKRRIDVEGAPVRIEGTDIYNRQLQNHYQNVRQIIEDQQSNSQNLADDMNESRRSFSEKRDYFEQRFKTPSPTYDSPPRNVPTQKLVTTITTTTTTTTAKVDKHNDRTSSSSNESPSVDNLLEQAVELQKLSHISSPKTDLEPPLVIERTEQYQVFLDASNHEIRRTPSVSRTALIHATRTGHATDLDQALAERVTDDHQAIQNFTRILQEHQQNTTNTNEISSFSSDINPISTSSVVVDNINQPVQSDFHVIDALLVNPLMTTNDKSNRTLQLRYNDILTNLRNPEWINSIRQSLPKGKSPKQPKEKSAKKTQEKPVKKTKEKSEKKPKEKSVKQPEKKKDAKIKSKSTKDQPEEEISSPPVMVNTSEQLASSPTELITSDSSEQTPLIDPKDKKTSKKENKMKNIKTKTKAKGKSEAIDYQVIDAIIGTPTLARVPDAYLDKYKTCPPLTQSSPIVSLPPLKTTETDEKSTKKKTKEKTKDKKKKQEKITSSPSNNETVGDLVKIVNDIFLHNAAALVASVPSSSSTVNAKDNDRELKTQQNAGVNESSLEQPLASQSNQVGQTITKTSPAAEVRPQSESIKPRVIYRYMDEEGHVLAMSSTPPSQLRDQPSKQYPYRTAEPSLLYGKHIAIDDERRHLLPQYEQRATWQGEPKLPTTVTREDFELRDRRVPHLSEQPIGSAKTLPVSYEPNHSSRDSTGQIDSSRISQHGNQQNVKLAWLPLSYPNEQIYPPAGATGYETDSTVSERSVNYRPYEYGMNEGYYQPSSRPLYRSEHQYSHSQGPANYPPPPPLPYHPRRTSPEYGIGMGGISRNYLEIFRGGDFCEDRPSEVYSLPLTDHVRRSPLPTSQMRPSRYDQYQSERYATMANRRSTPTLYPSYYYNDLRYPSNIPTAPATVYTSSYYAHRSPPERRPVQSSPNREYNKYIRHSKSFDYRPLRTKIQREYKITPNLLIDEWDYPSQSEKNHYSTATATTNRSGVSSPDDVFLKFRWQVRTSAPEKPIERKNETPKRQSNERPQFLPAEEEQRGKSRSPIYKAVALHSFYPQTHRELSFKKGETFFVTRRINDDWLEGEHQGSIGIFPLNHVELVPLETKDKKISLGEATVKYDFIPQKNFELELRKGDQVILHRRLNDNWYEGRSNQSEGIFPAAYVEVIREPADEQSNKNEANVSGRKLKGVLKTSSEKRDPTIVRKCEVLYDYSPQNPDELEIHVGDIITIVEMCDDGWFCGVMEKSKRTNQMEFGTFPGNYVRILPEK